MVSGGGKVHIFCVPSHTVYTRSFLHKFTQRRSPTPKGGPHFNLVSLESSDWDARGTGEELGVKTEILSVPTSSQWEISIKRDGRNKVDLVLTNGALTLDNYPPTGDS